MVDLYTILCDVRNALRMTARRDIGVTWRAINVSSWLRWRRVRRGSILLDVGLLLLRRAVISVGRPWSAWDGSDVWGWGYLCWSAVVRCLVYVARAIRRSRWVCISWVWRTIIDGGCVR